jgi:hypothetical protein
MAGAVDCRCVQVSIELFIEDQAFLRSYNSAPLPSPFPLSPVSKLYLFLGLPECRRSNLRRERAVGGGVETYHTTARKPGLLYIIQYSLLPPVPINPGSNTGSVAISSLWVQTIKLAEAIPVDIRVIKVPPDILYSNNNGNFIRCLENKGATILTFFDKTEPENGCLM